MTGRYDRHTPACVHVETGATLQSIRDYLIHLTVDLSNTYGKTARQVRAAEQALNSVDRLRSVMDAVSSGEIPQDVWVPEIYYGGADPGRRQVYMERLMEVHWAAEPDCPNCAADGREVGR